MSIRAVVLNDTRVDRHHGCTTVMRTIETLCAANGIAIIASSPAHLDWRRDEVITAAIDRADCVIVNGEGTIHHDRPAGTTLLAVGPFARKRQKSAFLINSTWQANSADSFRMLEAFDLISVRESASEAELRKEGFTPLRMPDLALYERSEGFTQRDGQVGYSDSVEGPKALALYRRMWELRATPVPIVQLPADPLTFLRWLKRFDPLAGALVSPKHLRDAWRATFQDYRTQFHDHKQFFAELASKDLIVTGRFHMMIFALASMTPFLVIGSNTHKSEATVRDAGLEPWRIVQDPSVIDAVTLRRAKRWNGSEQSGLRQYVAKGRADMELLFAAIANKLK